MAQHCEVCRIFKPELTPVAPELVELSLDVRAVLLCRGHARIAKNSGVRTFKALRELYGDGRRSYVSRRRPEPPPRRSERRANGGRRATD
jgi:hypothetical protein